ncbi:MAG TPA: error-prone DNA polymerase [Rhizomicrobium sp.]|jgi:error-prone DNA polymerase|nr:error-prone DNA polymerase [Rhizomicrobium sp.]
MTPAKAVRDKRAPKPQPPPRPPLDVLANQPPYAEIAVTSNFSFLRGASTPGELMLQATLSGYTAIGIADRNTLAGVVRAYSAFQDPEFPARHPKLLVGARLVFSDEVPDILAYPTDRAAYGNLCRLLSAGKFRAKKGECTLYLQDLLDWQEGLLLAVVAPARGVLDKIREALETLRSAAPDRVWLAASMPHRGDDRRRLKRLKTLARDAQVPLLAVNDVLYHAAERRELQDVVTCIREHVTIDKAGKLLEANAERHLKTPVEMERLFANAPEAIAETIRFSERISFSLDQLKYNYPHEPVPPGKTAEQHLHDLTWEGAARRYPQGIPDKVRETLNKELAIIAKQNYAHYFLTVHDIVAFANEKNILCQGRGSAANSAVCYAIGVTAVDPTQIDLLFERFVSAERKEPPDIDVDFEHERREEVIQHIYKRYGHHRAALTATVISYRPRSAIREVGKVFGLSEDITSAMSGSVWGSWGEALKESQVRQGKLDPQNAAIFQAVKFANQIMGFPRHLSQHVGGFVLTEDRLDTLVPIGPAAMEDRYFIEWDKDDLDRAGLMKVDVLALGMLTCIRKAFDLIHLHGGERCDLATVPRERPEVYDMLCKADAIGVFQVESRAQMNMLPRLRPRKFYDLVVEVAIVRPGPIQGNMVHPYLKRRKDPSLIDFPAPAEGKGDPNELRDVLGKTMGVPLFQEQAMKLVMVAAKFTPEEANGLRRAMATFRNVGTIGQFEKLMVSRMTERGYTLEFAQNCFHQIEGFGSYGFPESHAASFAHLVYISAWIKCHHPAAFACALLNAQPMGFYAPAEIVRDAREHAVDVFAPDMNFSAWDNSLEPNHVNALALRLGFRQIDGFKEEWAWKIVENRGYGYARFEEFVRCSELPKKALMLLADADGFRSVGLDRREAIWAVRRLADHDTLPLFEAQRLKELPVEQIAPLPAMPLSEHVLADYQTLRLSLKGYPMQFLRAMFDGEKVKSCAAVEATDDGRRVRCAGVVLVRQMPGDAGVVFITLSDETGITNVVMWPALVKTFRREIMGARLLLVEGKVQKSEGVVHLVAERLFDRSLELDRLSEDTLRPFQGQLEDLAYQRPDSRTPRHPRNVRVLPKSRDFH